MPDAVRNALERKLAAYEAAGMDDLADAVRARLSEPKTAKKAKAKVETFATTTNTTSSAGADAEPAGGDEEG